MSRYFTRLTCGCLVSCDGGGGLMPCTYDDKINPDCKFLEYAEDHVMLFGLCRICHPIAFKEEVSKYGTAKEKRKYL
jgi:hypothetical protein